ncbi:MAG: peptidase U32 family protein [Promethearchaeota archaeon]
MNKNNKRSPELLVPIQDWNSLKTILSTDNADAIYFGVQNYNMRGQAKNFTEQDLNKISNHCHNRERYVKTYLTTNILIYDSELQDLENLILGAKNAGIDGIICHDLAAIKIAKKNKIEFHISTQANISNLASALFYEDIGAKRINLARELSLKQIKKIKTHLKKTEIECFVHGSMCTSISGRCYLSAVICDSEEFSANRGKCIQPCRRKWKVIDDDNNIFIYDGQRFLNSRDLCMIKYIPQLIEAKIDSFKIEGRMKDPIYVKVVSSCYREAIESYYNGTFCEEKVKEWLARLSKVYNRGFHTGFYFHRPTIEEVELIHRGNISPWRKRYIGEIISFDDMSMTANVLIENVNIPIKIGSEIIIRGNDTYHIDTIQKIHVKGKKVEEIIRNQGNKPLNINIRLGNRAETKDRIYILTKV